MTMSIDSPRPLNLDSAGAAANVGPVHIWCFGKPKNYFIERWDLSGSFGAVRSAMRELGISKLFMPRPGFNGACIRARQLPRRFGTEASGMVRTGRQADAIILARGEAAAWASADCPTVVIHNEASREAAVIHAGRFSLLPQHLRPGQSGAIREHSPWDAIRTTVVTAGWQPKHLHVATFLGIGPRAFTHEAEGGALAKRNAEILDYIRVKYGRACTPGPADKGRLDLAELVRAICTSLGIPESRIRHDGADTFADENCWWSYRRGDSRGRNLVVAKNSA